MSFYFENNSYFLSSNANQRKMDSKLTSSCVRTYRSAESCEEINDSKWTACISAVWWKWWLVWKVQNYPKSTASSLLCKFPRERSFIHSLAQPRPRPDGQEGTVFSKLWATSPRRVRLIKWNIPSHGVAEQIVRRRQLSHLETKDGAGEFTLCLECFQMVNLLAKIPVMTSNLMALFDRSLQYAHNWYCINKTSAVHQ